MLDQQDRHAGAGQPGRAGVGEGLGLGLVQARRRLVEQQQPRAAGERAAQLDQPGLAGRQLVGPGVATSPTPTSSMSASVSSLTGIAPRSEAGRDEPGLGQQRELALRRLRVAAPAPAQLGPDEDVLARRQRPEQLEALERAGDAGLRPLVGPQPGDVVAAEPDPPRRGGLEPGDHVERGRLAGAVGPDEAR